MITPLILLILGIIFLRTMLWHVQSWQLREYRIDRMREYLRLKKARHELMRLWFFRGVLPRPTFTLRSTIVIIGTIIVSSIIFLILQQFLHPVWSLIITERLLWLTVFLSVMASKIYKYIYEQYLYKQAKKLRMRAKNMTVIAITGSYGKSSTKQILHCLLVAYYGEKKVLTPPKNTNTEVGLAQFIRHNQAFMHRTDKRVLLLEMGAYTAGDIAIMCDYAQPDIGLLTAVSNQHLGLFGTRENLKKAKFELAEGTKKTFYYNPERADIAELLERKNIPATVKKVPFTANILEVQPDSTRFTIDNTKFLFPWPGAHFTENVEYAVAIMLDLGMPLLDMVKPLKHCTSPEHGIKTKILSNGVKVLYDLYSANEQGALAAIRHLGNTTGRKIAVMMPLRELGPEIDVVHQRIFEALKDSDAELFWPAVDHKHMAKDILNKKFLGDDYTDVLNTINTLEEGDMIYFGRRLQPDFVDKVLGL